MPTGRLLNWPTHTTNGHKEVVEFLIAKGADVKVKDNQDRTPLQLAIEIEEGHTEIVELLPKLGAKE